tara:strand:+ start:33 stop:269 length:237 start_codon:yes stop_codon:yes gene_type:complete
MIDKLATLRKLLWFFVEFFSLVLVLIIFIYFLLGQSSGPFILGVIENIGLFVKAVGKNAIVAILIIISLVLYLNNRRS